MQRVNADRGLGGSKPFHAAYQEGLARTFRACHEPMPARMQELMQQLGERDAAMDDARDRALGDAAVLAQYYAAPLPRRDRGN